MYLGHRRAGYRVPAVGPPSKQGESARTGSCRSAGGSGSLRSARL